MDTLPAFAVPATVKKTSSTTRRTIIFLDIILISD
jgi:hypothetical protein